MQFVAPVEDPMPTITTTTSSASIQWNEVYNTSSNTDETNEAEYYRIVIQNPSGDVLVDTSTNAFSYDISGLRLTPLRYRVFLYAINSAGSSPGSETEFTTYPNVDGAGYPTISSISLVWKPVLDTSDEYFKVRILNPSGDVIVDISQNTTRYDISGLMTTSSPYTAIVISANSEGEGSTYQEQFITYYAPTNVQITTTASSASISWDPVLNRSEEYFIVRIQNPSGDTIVDTSTNALTYDISGLELTPLSYTLTIQSAYALGTSLSTVLEFTTYPAPSNISITTTTSSASISWNAVLNTPEEYFIVRIMNPSGDIIVDTSTNALTYDISGLELTPLFYMLTLQSATPMLSGVSTDIEFTTYPAPQVPYIISGPTYVSPTSAMITVFAGDPAFPPVRFIVNLFTIGNLGNIADGQSLVFTSTTSTITLTGISLNKGYSMNITAVGLSGILNTYFYTGSYTHVNNTTNVPCFLGNAPVKTPTGYRRIDSLQEGDLVLTGDGRPVAIQRVKHTLVAAGPLVNPYIIPRGRFGAEKRLLISPNHRVQVDGHSMIEARNLGLQQEEKSGQFVYYNLELPDWGRDTMVVAGVVVESLAHVRRMTMSIAEFKVLLSRKYGSAANAPEVLKKVLRTCRMLPNGRIEAPVV